MRKFVLSLIIVTVVLSGTVTLSSRESEIPCCRPICDCNPKNVTCDFNSIEECRDLGGWEVRDCSECASREVGE